MVFSPLLASAAPLLAADNPTLFTPLRHMGAVRKTSLTLLIVAAFAGGVFFTTAGANWAGIAGHLRSSEAAETSDVGTRLSANPATLEEAFVAVAERVNPTVVQIRSTREMRGRTQRNPFEGTPWEDFFGTPGGPGTPSIPSQGLGSGVIIREDGYILTNNHVVEDASALRVHLFGGAEYDATVVGTDPASDLAVVKIEARDLPAMSLGDINDVRVGQWVMAFGSPLAENLSNTVTSGIVSALGRYDDIQARQQEASLQGYIQTDAAINPGNSGGPLVNLRGELIGLNNAIYTRTGGYQGIGFAIPVDVIRNVSEQLIESGSVRRALLGVTIQGVSESLARALDLPRGAAQIGSVSEGSAAARAGLQESDIILALDGRELRDFREVTQRILNKRPGDEVEITFLRDRDRRTVKARLGERDMAAQAAENEEETPEARTEPAAAETARFADELGFSYANFAAIPAQQRNQMGLATASREGVVITDVDVASSAFRDAGIRAGYFIVSVNGEAVASLRDFEKAYRAVRPGETFFLRLQAVARDGSTSTVRTALTKPQG